MLHKYRDLNKENIIIQPITRYSRSEEVKYRSVKNKVCRELLLSKSELLALIKVTEDELNTFRFKSNSGKTNYFFKKEDYPDLFKLVKNNNNEEKLCKDQ